MSSPVLVIAEAGVNHNGSLDCAKELIDVASAAGADAVKFQTFRSESVISRGARKAQYQVTNTGNNERYAETSAVPGTGISVAGQRNLGNGFVVDGLSANDDAADLAGTFFSQEVIREFQVVTSGGIAEFGRAS